MRYQEDANYYSKSKDFELINNSKNKIDLYSSVAYILLDHNLLRHGLSLGFIRANGLSATRDRLTDKEAIEILDLAIRKQDQLIPPI